MDPIVEAGAAAVATGYLVSLAKHAKPTAPSWVLVSVALLGGVLCAGLVTVASGELLLHAQTAARTVLTGIGAAAMAAGLSRTDAAGEAKRLKAEGEQ